MAGFDPLRITDDEERVTLAPVQGPVGGWDVDCDWERDGSTVAWGLQSEWSGEDIFVVSLAGEHDLYTAPKVQEALRSAIAAGAKATVVDLSETTFLDSTMLQVFLSARSELRDGGRLLLASGDATVKRVFEIAGIDPLFDFHSSRRAAEEALRSHDHEQ
jgi:anti-sigma B factor antagonist